MKSLLNVAGALIPLALVACSEQLGPFVYTLDAAPGAPTPANAMCPISGHSPTPEIATVQYQGTTIGFCTDRCQPEFEKLDEAGKLAALAAAGVHLVPPR